MLTNIFVCMCRDNCFPLNSVTVFASVHAITIIAVIGS